MKEAKDEGDFATFSVKISEGTVVLPSAIQKAMGEDGIYILTEMLVELPGKIASVKSGYTFTPHKSKRTFTLAAEGKALKALKEHLEKGTTTFKILGVLTEPKPKKDEKKPPPHIEASMLSEWKPPKR